MCLRHHIKSFSIVNPPKTAKNHHFRAFLHDFRSNIAVTQWPLWRVRMPELLRNCQDMYILCYTIRMHSHKRTNTPNQLFFCENPQKKRLFVTLFLLTYWKSRNLVHAKAKKSHFQDFLGIFEGYPVNFSPGAPTFPYMDIFNPENGREKNCRKKLSLWVLLSPR